MSPAKLNGENLVYDAGVYAVVSRKSGAMYVGSSCNLMARLDQHRRAIRRQVFKSDTEAYRQAFAGHTEQDIEFRILERVEVRASGPMGQVCGDPAAKAGRRNLLDREGHWVRTLKPSVNSPRFHRPRLGHKIPVVDLSKQSA